MIQTMKQGEIWMLDLNPIKGSEQAGKRPCVIISGNVLNTFMNTVIVCPLTTQLKHYKGNVILEPHKKNGLKDTSEVLVFHIRSVSKERLTKRLGSIFRGQMVEVIGGLNDILKY